MIIYNGMNKKIFIVLQPIGTKLKVFNHKSPTETIIVSTASTNLHSEKLSDS